MFSKVGHIFSENNKCVQGSAVNHSIKEPHWPTVCFSCRGVQAAHLIMTVRTTFFLVVKHIYFFFSIILLSLFFGMHSGQEDDSLVFLWSNGQQSEIVCMVRCVLNCSFICFRQEAGWNAHFVLFHRANRSEISGFHLHGQRN